MADLLKFKKIINKVTELGFNDFYQAGSVSRIHELNLIVDSESQDRKYWLAKSFGEFVVIYRKGIDDIKAIQHRFKCKNQKEVCEKFSELILQS